MPFVEYGNDIALFCWAGDRVLDTLVVQLRDCDLPVARDALAIIVHDTSADALKGQLRALAAEGPRDGVEMARTVANKMVEKFHPFLDDELLSKDYASRHLDPDGAWQTLVRIVGQIDAL